MENGWVKLHRKAKENGLIYDALAWQVFCWLLLSVDRKTGSYTTGRFLLASTLRINPNTLKSVLHRLNEKYQVLNLNSTNKYTTITLTNWAKYQHDDQPTPQATPTKHQQNTTKQELRSKEYIDKSIGVKHQYGNEEINKILKDFERLTGHIPADRKPRLVAHNIRQITNTFIREYASLYERLRGKPLTFTYVLDFAWKWYAAKDYAATTEKLETFKLKYRVFLDDVGKKLTEEGRRLYETTEQATGLDSTNGEDGQAYDYENGKGVAHLRGAITTKESGNQSGLGGLLRSM